jgi:hypothetical protein
MTQIDDTQNAQSTKTHLSNWKQITPDEMAFWLNAELDITPRWRVLKRMQLKRNIKFWTQAP